MKRLYLFVIFLCLLFQSSAARAVFLMPSSLPMTSNLTMAIIADVSYDTLERMIQGGADVNGGLAGALTPMEIAVAKDNLPVAELLLKNGADLNRPTLSGTPLLFMAISPKMAQFLLKQGLEPDVRDRERYTPLMKAAADGEADMLKVFLENGADINASTVPAGCTLPETALTIAARENEDRAAVKVLAAAVLKKNGRLPPLALAEAAAYNSNPDVLKMLLKMKADVNARTPYGMTPLMLAALLNANPKKTELLIRYGADVNAVFVPGSYETADVCGDPFLDSVVKDDWASALSLSLLKNMRDTDYLNAHVLTEAGAKPEYSGRHMPLLIEKLKEVDRKRREAGAESGFFEKI